MIGDHGQDSRGIDDPVSDAPPALMGGGTDPGPQLLRMLTLLARFGIDPTAPALLEQRYAVLT